MKLTFSKSPGSPAGLVFKFGAHNLLVEDVASAHHVEIDGVQLFLEGEIHYATVGEHATYATVANTNELIGNALAKYGPVGFPHAIEGAYVGVWVNRAQATAGLFCDAQNRRWLYCNESPQAFFASTQLKDTVARASSGGRLNQYALYSYLLLGYTPVAETLYQGVFRPAIDEHIVFSVAGVSHKVEKRERKIEPYEKPMIDRYDSVLTDAIQSRAAHSQNYILNSGGWDSTTLIYKLLQGRDAKSVSSVVCDFVLPDGRSFNSYEVDKAKRIANFYGITVDRAVMDYGDKSLVEFWESQTECLRDHHIYFGIFHFKMAAILAVRGVQGAAAFNGEAADSIHNFGFSQFVSVNYDTYSLRHYADKMKNYLYGPTFLGRIEDGSHAADKVYQFFQYYYGQGRFEDLEHLDSKQQRDSYLQAFVLSYPRVPFAKWHDTTYTTQSLRTGFAQHLSERYFADAVANLSPRTLYYYLLQQYRQFHLQGCAIHVNPVAFASSGISSRIPFMDTRLIDYMYSMPEDWGRGLELRTTKYPLRYLANERWHMPIHILEESGPHSYISESDPRWNYSGGKWTINCEIMFKSVLKGYFQSLFGKTPVEAYFDPAFFDIKYLQGTLDAYRAGTENPDVADLLYKLGLLYSIGVLS